MEPISALIAAGIALNNQTEADKRAKRADKAQRRIEIGRADFMRKWLHPEQRVALAEQSLGGGGGLFDERKARLGDAQKLDLMGSEAALNASRDRSRMLREAIRARQIGGAANAASGLLGMMQSPAPAQAPQYAPYNYLAWQNPSIEPRDI